MSNIPVDSVRIPNCIKRHERLLRNGEYEALKKAAQKCKNTLICQMEDFAIETVMRRSKILSLRWENLSDAQRIASLSYTKNGSKRDVPLSQKVANLSASLRACKENIFPTSNYAVRHAWDRLVKRAGIADLRFHDLRHEAVSRFFEIGSSVPKVVFISGHTDYRMLTHNTHLTAEKVRN